MSQREVAVLAGTLLAGLLHWLWMRRLGGGASG
jgi:hypothetical protein